jgi:hypothetical protein
MDGSDCIQIREHRSCTLVTALLYWLETRYYLVDHEGPRTKPWMARASGRASRDDVILGNNEGVVVARSNNSLQS